MKLKKTFTLCSLMMASVSMLGCSGQDKVTHVNAEQEIWPNIETGIAANPEMEAKIAKILTNMTLEQKIAQMIQPKLLR